MKKTTHTKPSRLKRPKLSEKPRGRGQPLADAVREKFAQHLAAGDTATDALKAAKPAVQEWGPKSINAAACRMASEPEVKSRRDEILVDMIPATVMKKTDLMVLLSDELREAAREPGMLSASAALVDKFIRLMDWYPKQELTVKNGGVSEDYKAPPAIRNLDADTLRKIAEGTL